MENNTFKPFAIGDRVISEADGPGTVVDSKRLTSAFPVCVNFDRGIEFGFDQTGKYLPVSQETEFDIRHMTAEELKQFPKPK